MIIQLHIINSENDLQLCTLMSTNLENIMVNNHTHTKKQFTEEHIPYGCAYIELKMLS